MSDRNWLTLRLIFGRETTCARPPASTFILITLLCLIPWPSTAQAQKPSSSKHVEALEPSSDELFSAGMDVLAALGDFYLASVELDQDDQNAADARVQLMEHLLNEKKALRSGCLPLRKYKNNPNEAIQVAAEGSILGAEMIIGANDNLLELLRTAGRLEPQNMQFFSVSSAILSAI